MKRRIYIARKILPDPSGENTLDINSSMSVEKITSLYVAKENQKERFIHNGHWILRSVDDSTGTLRKSDLPTSLTPSDVLGMVKAKIDSSDACVAFLDDKSFGAIVELGYAVGKGNVACYVLPEGNLKRREVKDLWLSFQFALQTRHLWRQEDIGAIEEFNLYDIQTIQDYENFLLNTIPVFLERE